MAIEDEGVYNHAEFKGLRNNVDAEGFDLGDLDAATNVDIDDAGDARMRRGYPAASVAGAAHSLWSDGNTCLAVVSGVLSQIHPDLSTTPLLSGFSDAPVSYDSPPGSGRVYWSNGVLSGVVERGVSRSWGLPVPPRLSAVASIGALPAGRYQFAGSYLRNDGQESGVALAGELELASPGGLLVSLPSWPSDTLVDSLALYVSKPNGSELYRERVIPVGASSVLVTHAPSGLVTAVTQHLSPPPPGNIVGYFAGRMYVAANGTLYPSRPYAYELFDLREGIYYGGAEISLFAPVNDGVYVSAGSRTLFHAGRDPSSWGYDVKASYGAIPGTSYRDTSAAFDPKTDGACVVWASPRGVCVGFDGGRLVNLTEDRFSFPNQPAGAGVVRPWRGTQQFLTTLRGAEVPGNIAG